MKLPSKEFQDIRYIFWADWSDAPPPTLVVSISASPDPVESRKTSTITVTVTVGGVAIAAATVTVSTTCGSLLPLTGTTDAYGKFYSTFTSPNTTIALTCTITATTSKAGYTNGSNTYGISVLGSPLILREGILGHRLAARRFK